MIVVRNLCFVGLAVVCGCGDRASVPDDGGSSTADRAEGTGPTIRDVQVAIAGSTPLTVDLRDGSSTVILPYATTAEWIVQARDDLTPPEQLVIELIDPDEGRWPDQTVLFDRGNWRVSAPIGPGNGIGVVARDAFGIATRHPHTIRIPSLEEAIEGRWERRTFDESQRVTARTRVDIRDGEWSRSGPGVDDTLTASYSVAAASITLQIRTQSGSDTDPTTVEREETSAVFIDQLYLSRQPWVRVSGETSGTAGSYRRTLTRTEAGVVHTIEETLALGEDGSFAQLSSEDSSTILEILGTYRISLTENYEESLGDFLVVTETTVNAVPVAAPEARVALFIGQGETLLIDPLIRLE